VRTSDHWTRVLAIAGTALVWLALLAPFVSPFWVLVQRAFFALGLAGGALLLWAALRCGVYRRLTGISLGHATASLVLGRALTGVLGAGATGALLTDSTRSTLVLAAFVIHLLALIALGVGGILLVRAGAAANRDIGVVK
jgi:hypothetical protein